MSPQRRSWKSRLIRKVFSVKLKIFILYERAVFWWGRDGRKDELGAVFHNSETNVSEFVVRLLL